MKPDAALIKRLYHFGPGTKAEVAKELGISEAEVLSLADGGWIRREPFDGGIAYLNLRPANLADKAGSTPDLRDAIARANAMLNAIADKRPPPKRRLVGGSLRIEGVGATDLHDYFTPEQPGFFVESARSAGVDLDGGYPDSDIRKIVNCVVAGVNDLEAEQERELAAEGAVPEPA